MRFLFVALVACCFICAVYGEEGFLECKASRVEADSSGPGVFEPEEILASLSKVNVVTGEYCDEECDLVVAGIEPLSLKRFYSHFAAYHHHLTGHWRVLPQTHMLFDFGNAKRYVLAGELNGSSLLYESRIGNALKIDTQKHKSQCCSSGQGHPLHREVSYKKYEKRVTFRRFRQPETHCWWEGVITEGSGHVRFFKTAADQWPEEGKEPPMSCIRRRNTGEIEYTPLSFIPPFQAQLTEERLANGNVLRYEYEDVNSIKGSGTYYTTCYLPKSIKAYSKQGTFLGSIDASYAMEKSYGRDPLAWVDRTIFRSSDGRQVIQHNRQHEIKAKTRHYDAVLDRVERPGQPNCFYRYYHAEAKYYHDRPFLEQVLAGHRLTTQIHYDGEKKVSSIRAPVGKDGEMVAVARYVYRPGATDVYDGVDNKTTYLFNEEQRIIAIQHFEGERLYSMERMEWDRASGNLLLRWIEDGSRIHHFAEEFSYDVNQNVALHQVVLGDRIERTFSLDGFNLVVSQSDRPGRETKYRYVEGTDLVSSELVTVDGKICRRVFKFYDSQIGSFCIKTIVDDGCSEDPDDLTGVTLRRLTEREPKRSAPCIGLVEEEREKTINSFGEEILLKKVRYGYIPCGKIEREDHFDALDRHRYSIINEYDADERLISVTDALGHQ